ncbi:MAG TPA: hypothetical protein VFN94_05175, partial [Nitrospiria bacterium]|nr:hypothetical protein [Nitrospiria bacterium]
AAIDPPSNTPGGLIYTVQYKRRVDAGFSSMPSGIGGKSVTLTGLVASTEYQIRLVVSDQSANQADVVLEAAPTFTPSAGRLYVANKVYNAVGVFSDVGQASGNKPGGLVTADQTGLVAPTGIAVDRDPADPTQLDPDGYVYVAEAAANRIAAYKLCPTGNCQALQLGQFSIGHNVAPAWTIEGDLASTDLTELCGPATLRLERRADGRKVLYAANSLVLPVGSSSPACVPNKIVAFDVTRPPQGTNQPPMTRIERPRSFFSPLAFTLNEQAKLLFVANRDDLNGVGNNAGSTIDVYSYAMYMESADQTPHRTFWGSADNPCVAPASEPGDHLCGPTALAYDALYDRLYVINRGKSDLLVFSDVSSPLTVGRQVPAVVQGANTGLDGARPVGIFLDSVTRRVYVTTDTGQSVVIFDADELAVGGNVPPRRVIKGTKTLLGQPTKDSTNQSSGPFAVTVVGTEAFVVTPGIYPSGTGLTPLPSMTVFNVSDGADPTVLATDPLSARTTNTVPSRALVDPMLGASAVALDPQSGRLYVAGFDANMILVFDDPQSFATGQIAPDRILAGPSTRLDHPVALLFRRQDASANGSLYVVNQSSHSVSVFLEGDGAAAPLLAGDRAPARYIGPPDGTDPFSVTANVPQMVFPTGLTIDPGVAADLTDDILYVSNRDAESFQDLVGRRIVAFQDANTVNGAVAPTWKVEGDRPPTGSAKATDKTTLKRPAGLWMIPDPLPNDGTPDDRLVVANRDGKSVLIFRGLRALVAQAAANPGAPPEDNRAPAWTIKHFKLVAPFGVVFEQASRQLYVSDIAGRILAFDLTDLDTDLADLDIDTPEPALTPRVVEGASTGLAAPLGLALDPQN